MKLFKPHHITPFIALLALASCDPARETAAEKPSVTLAQLQAVKRAGEPIVRVRIQRGPDRVTLTGPTQLQISSSADPSRTQLVSSPFEISRRGGQWIGKFQSPGMASGDTINVQAVGPSPIQLDHKASYPGYLRLVPVAAAANGGVESGGGFDVINHVRLEAYLPGVLDRELYDNWDPAAYLAQAIAARSYAIDRIITEGPGRYFDMENTQASQAYSGRTSHILSLRAVADTVGLVLAHNDRIITAYYSSTCGSANQSAADAFGTPDTLPPLNPRTACQWCSASQHYQWRPISRHRQDLSKRIAAWGRGQRMTIGKLRTITEVGVAQTNALGRPVLFHITDETGQTYALRGESFRHACNYRDEKLPLAAGEQLKSSAFEVRVKGDMVLFENGRGFGHCVGLCQFGAQGQARAGKNPIEILAQYYPGATIERAY